MLKAPRLFLCLNGRKTYAYIPPEVVALRTPLSKITSTGEIEQRFRLN